MNRDEFSKPVKEALAKRVAFRCSNPSCKLVTAGPHSDSQKSVSLGVAAHITAASPGGPRYDEIITSLERSSIDNAIWLCQNCAKLIDSDSSAFSLSTIYRWKVNSESEALRSLKGAATLDYFPQPPSAIHAPLPRIGGLTYDEAREMLVQAGWQPVLQPWPTGSEPAMTYGNGLYFWNKGFHEISNACPTGLAYCTFNFSDVYNTKLVVVTAGEATGDPEISPRVWSWRFESNEAKRFVGIYT